jgi:hypothetical protein
MRQRHGWQGRREIRAQPPLHPHRRRRADQRPVEQRPRLAADGVAEVEEARLSSMAASLIGSGRRQCGEQRGGSLSQHACSLAVAELLCCLPSLPVAVTGARRTARRGGAVGTGPMQDGMKEARNSPENEGDGRSRGFGVRPPGSRCRRKNVKSSLEEAFGVTGAGGLTELKYSRP